jgi:hypothetical protein
MKSFMLMIRYKKSCRTLTFKHHQSFYRFLYISVYYQHHRISLIDVVWSSLCIIEAPLTFYYLCIPLSCGDLSQLLFVNCGQFLFYIQLGTDFVAKIVAPDRRKLVQILKSSMLMIWYKKSCSKWTFKHQKSFLLLALHSSLLSTS